MGLFDRTQYSYWKTNQSYNLFWVLSILGGILALDHLYLRSPLTFLAKIIVNIFGLGIWWIYDATQASFNKDVVKMYGLGIPGIGSMGIGAGSMAGDKPDDKHANFLIYSLALLFGGLFGIDSFITGDKSTGYFRLLCLISFIFTPVAILYWLFNVGKFFFKTESVIEQNWEYFGAPKPEHLKKTFIEQLVDKFPFLKGILGYFMTFKNTVVNLSEHPLSGIQTLKEDAKAAISAPILKTKEVLSELTSAIEREAEIPIKEGETLIEKTLSPIESAIQPIASAITGAEKVASNGIDTVKTLGEGTINAIKSIGQLAVLPSVTASTINSISSEELKNALKTQGQQQGGTYEETSYIVYAFLGTIAIIAVSGIIKTYRRLRQNSNKKNDQYTNKQKRDDTPPEPRTI
jgi:hypothetical protein